MAHWMKRIFMRTTKKAQITFCGLDAAGKTTILNYLLQGDKTETVPTTGINYDKIVLKHKIRFDIYDLPGQKALKHLWDKFILSSNLLVFVVDSGDMNRLDEAKDLFWEVYAHQENKTTPICILGNKQDLAEHIKIPELIDHFELNKLENTKWQVFPTSAYTGEGIIESFQWIYETISGKKVQMKIQIHDLMVITTDGEPVTSKRNLLGESTLSAGLITAIRDFSTTLNQSADLNSISMGKQIIYCKTLGEYTLALITNRASNEKVGISILNAFGDKLEEQHFENPHTILHNFTMSELKGLI